MSSIERARPPERFLSPLSENRIVEPYREIYRFDPEKMWRIAEQMLEVSLQVKEGDRLLIDYHPGGRQLAEMLAFKAGLKGAAVVPRGSDQSVWAAVLAGISQHPTERVLDDINLPISADVAWATHFALIRFIDTAEAMEIVPSEIIALNETTGESNLQIRVNRRRWCVIYLPSPVEAKKNGLSFPQYAQIYLNACDRPWQEVGAAQEILIEEILNGGKILEIFADENNPDEKWRTHVRMSIAGMTFANSTIHRNFPGNEWFSAPKRGTTEGRWALPYPVMFGGRVLPNLCLDFSGGKIVDFFTDGDTNFVRDILDTDEGAREVGEIAGGGNSELNRPFLNPLLIEKVAGSWHLTPGHAYAAKTYMGKPVVTDNGVRSAIHEDLTRMLTKSYGGGRVLSDGTLIQKDGFFLDSRLSLLNPKT